MALRFLGDLTDCSLVFVRLLETVYSNFLPLDLAMYSFASLLAGFFGTFTHFLDIAATDF